MIVIGKSCCHTPPHEKHFSCLPCQNQKISSPENQRASSSPPASEKIGEGLYGGEITMHDVPTPEQIELWNSRLGLLGLVAALGAYALTGQVIPGLW
jgi:hypothetical protein